MSDQSTDPTTEDVRIHAPELAGALEWFNVPAPLTLNALRGKAVLLDFWTYGCVNCMHILPDLKRLEEKYRDELVVIGVHSAKFSNEGQSDNIRRIIVRYEIEHPVANDANFMIWRAYGARAWPTQVLIDPEGYIVATASGEGHAEGFDQAIGAVIQVFDEQGRDRSPPLPMAPERERLRTSTLAFPGKVLADEVSSRLFIADSSHHRVLVASMDGRVTDVIGRGPSADGRTSGAGGGDGAFGDARFYRPQGLAFDRDRQRLYIADTENHLIRAADLATRQVSTVAGTGKQAAWAALAARRSRRHQFSVGFRAPRSPALRRDGRHPSDSGSSTSSASSRFPMRAPAARPASTARSTTPRSRSRRGWRLATAACSSRMPSPTSSARSRCRRRTS